MSHWHEPRKEDIDLTTDGTELHVYLHDDSSGAVYVSLKVQDVREILSNA